MTHVPTHSPPTFACCGKRGRRRFFSKMFMALSTKNKDEGLQHLLEGIACINQEAGTDYQVSWKLLNAAHFGVPQNRERVFLIGSREGASFEFPLPTHGPAKNLGLFNDQEPYRTAWDALADLPAVPDESSLEVGGKWGALLPSIPEGQNYLWHTNRGGGLRLFGWRTRYWSFLLKLAKKPTIVDDSSTARLSDRSLSLAQQEADEPRNVPTPNFSGRSDFRLWPDGHSEDARQCRALSAC